MMQHSRTPLYFRHLLCFLLIVSITFLATSIHSSNQTCFSMHETEEIVDTWIGLNDNLDGGYINSIIIDQKNEKKLFAASRQHGIFMSSDLGQEWKNISLNLKQKAFNVLLLNPLENNCLYAGSYDKLYRTYNEGETWEKSESVFQGIVDLVALEDGSIIVSTRDGLYKSYAHVNNFKFHRILDNLAGRNEMISVAISSDRKIIAAGTAKQYVLLSFDSGSSWVRVTNGLPSDRVVSVFFSTKNNFKLYAMLENNGLWEYDIVVLDTKEDQIIWNLVHPETKKLHATKAILSHQRDIDILIGTRNQGLFIYSLRYNKLTQSSLYQQNAHVTSLACGANNQEIIVVGSSILGCLISINYGETWAKKNNKLYSVPVFDLVVDPFDPFTWYLSSFGSIYITRNRGKNWSILYDDLPSTSITALAVSPHHRNHLFVGTENQGLFFSSNRGRNFEKIDQFPFLWINCISIDHQEKGIVYVGTHGRGLFKTNDFGETWDALSFHIKPDFKSIFISTISIDPLDSSTVYIGSVDDGIYKSENKGLTWQHIYDPLGENIYINDIHINVNDTNMIFAGINIINKGGILKSYNKGEKWEVLNIFRSGMVFKSVLVELLDSEIIYACTRENIFVSKDGGRQWQSYGNGFHEGFWDDFGFINNHTILDHPIDKNKLLIANNWGIFECTKSDTLLDREKPEIEILEPVSFPFFSNNGYAPITGFVKDNNAVRELFIRGQSHSFDKISGKFEYEFFYTSKRAVLPISAIDLAGNIQEIELEFYLDNQKPLLKIFKPDNYTSVLINDVFVSGYAEDLENSIKYVEVNGISMPLRQEDRKYYFEYHYQALHKGENLLKIEASDLAGNVSSAELIVVFNSHDNQAPLVSIEHPKDILSYTNQSNAVIQGRIVDDESGLFRSTLNGVEFEVDQNGSFSVTVVLVDGENMFTLNAIDYNDNSISHQFSIILDTVKPQISIIGKLPEKTILNSYPLRFHAFDEHSGISRVDCLVNDQLQKTDHLITFEENSIDLMLSPGLNEVKLIAFDYALNTKELVFFLERILPSIIKLRIGSNKVIVIRGEEQREDILTTPPIIFQNRTMVPLRFISESFGAIVKWIPHPTNEIQLTYRDILVHLWIGRKEVIIEYTKDTTKAPDVLHIDTAPMIRNSSTLVPLRFLAELFGAKVDWDAKTQEITLILY